MSSSSKPEPEPESETKSHVSSPPPPPSTDDEDPETTARDLYRLGMEKYYGREGPADASLYIHESFGDETGGYGLIRKSAGRGYADAQNELGEQCARNGRERLAVIWFTLAADQGHPNAIFHLADCYENGNGVRKNTKKALELYEAVATSLKPGDSAARSDEGGDAAAQNEIGEFYMKRGSMRQAAEWFTLAADQKQPDAMYCLAGCYEHGDGVPKDTGKALKLYKAAALKWMP